MNDIDNFNMKGGAVSKMPHSHSTPAGVDGGSRTPPTTPRKAGKMLAVRVQMLDDSITMFQVQAKALGRVLFDQVCKQLHLLEADYFGLEYQEPSGTKYWLDLEKPVCRQVGLSLVDPLLRFCVKFYTPDPAQLEEEFTRYLFCLQIKRDLAQGLLQCNDNTAALMASYIVQAECGDYVIEDYPDHTYLSTYKFVPHQDPELERRIMENHKKHSGQSPAEADLNLLETARRCELYGMKMHPAKDHEGVPLNLAVAHMGIVVFQNFTKINTFNWAKIRKISFKRKRFLIKLHPESYGYYKDTVEFFFEGRNECKNFWKKCVENHGFFRCSVVKRVIRQKTRVLSRGSSFRYSGKTQKQIVEFVRDNYVKRQTFQRSNSFRQTSGGRALQGTEGGGYRGATSSSSLMGSSSISAHPLLPLGDPALATPALSLSCGSMTLDSPTTVTSVSMGGTIHRREDTATSFRTLTSIDVHSPATPNQGQAPRQSHATSQQQQRITSAGRISPSNSSPPEFPPPRPLPRHPWQRSASCRELYASSFEDSGRARSRDERKSELGKEDVALDPFRLPSQAELDNPITRYDESNRSYSAASSKMPSLDHDTLPDKVYSSSYPGTSSLSTESGHEESGPGGDLSHDDLSHDSYELLEREHEFEYPESFSDPRHDDDDEPMSDNSEDGCVEREMFRMDSDTDSFVKHKRPARTSLVVNELVVTESRIQRTATQIERKFETRHANSVDQGNRTTTVGGTVAASLQQQESVRKSDPVVVQVQRQKISVLNELKSLRPKHKITHVDSEVLRDEGIMRPKSRVDDDAPQVDVDWSRTQRARSIASLDDHPNRSAYVESGSLGRAHKSRERKNEARARRRIDKSEAKQRRSVERSDTRELRRSIERLERIERELELRERQMYSYEMRGKSVERLDYQDYQDPQDYGAPVKSKSKNHVHRYSDPRGRSCVYEYGQRHTIERSPSDRNWRENRGKSADRLDSRRDRPATAPTTSTTTTFDFDPRTIERLRNLERHSTERPEPRKSQTKTVEEKPRERDDWRSLEKARKDEERRERERQASKLSMESRGETVIGLPREMEYKTKTVFGEYEPKVVGGVVLGFDENSMMGHTPVERTKSDPNPGRQRLGSNSKRHMLTHQKSIDLTPADSGDEDPFSDSALTQKANADIPYILHKRHVMNGTASDERSESDSGRIGKIAKTGTGELSVSPSKPKSILSPADKPKSILSPTTKLSPTSPTGKSIIWNKQPSPERPPVKSASFDGRPRTEIVIEDRTCVKSSSLDKKPSKLSPIEPNITIISTIDSKPIKISPKVSPKISPTDPNKTILAALQRRKSPDSGSRSPIKRGSSPRASMSLADVVVIGMQRKLSTGKVEKDTLKAPDDSMEKQDSIEKIPLPEIPAPGEQQFSFEDIIPPPSLDEILMEETKRESESRKKEKTKTLEKPSIPEKTKRILEQIESRFSEMNKTSSTKVPRPKIVDTGFDDFVDPVADLPLDEVPVKPAVELDSLKVPEFMPFMLRPHGEPLRSKSLSLAEEKAPIDTLLSPEMESKSFVQDVSPKRAKKQKAEAKKDFKKQSKSLEGDKPPLKKTSSKESRISPASSKIDKSKLKLGEMPQEIIIIDSTDEPGPTEVSIVQKGRSKSVTRLPDRAFQSSKDEKEDLKSARAKSASVDDELMKSVKSEKPRPKSLGISKSLGSTEKKDSTEKISPKRTKTKVDAKSDSKPSSKEPSPKLEHKITAKPKAEPEVVQKIEKKPIEVSKDTKKALIAQELSKSPVVLRKPGQSPVLFARARLGLSEGSGIGALQRQGATQSPTAQRRAKSLDAPVISLNKLPPANAFSSKDDTVSEDNIAEESEQPSKQQSIQMEASPNHRSESTDHTTVPEICTDSLSVTETSAQYLESPLTEYNEIATAADIIPYEQEYTPIPIIGPSNGKETGLVSASKAEDTRFIDQSSIESTDQDPPAPSSKLGRIDKKELLSLTKLLAKSGSTDSNSSARDRRAKTEPPSAAESLDASTSETKKEVQEPEVESKIPDVTVTVTLSAAPEEPVKDFDQDDQDMVKSPIQISIEECTDEEMVPSDEQEDLNMLENLEIEDNRPLDSQDTSEDTLDALDAQQMRGPDSPVSSPDYGVDKMDEKTLVEVELTPEYLEMRKDDMDGAEELPEDEPMKDYMDPRQLSVDRKSRLSSERSRSEETSTWTPDREDPDSSSCSIARPLGIGTIQMVDRRELCLSRDRTEGSSIEEDNSSGSHAPMTGPRAGMSSTWKPFPLESSGSSSLEENWMPRDENNIHQQYSEDSNNGQNEDSFREDLADFPGSFIYPIGPEILANYGAFSLSRTLSRISERSTTSEQDKSDLEDSFKPSSRSPSLDDESMISSDQQPSLSSDPPSGTALPSVSEDRRTSSELPDIPIDAPEYDDGKSPRSNRRSRLQLQASEEWPSPPSSPVFETPLVSHVETFYMEIKPEEAVKVVVTDSTDTPGRVEESDSSDENQTLHDDLHSTLLEDGQSSTSATTVDGTVKIAVKPKSNSYITGSSHSEDTSMGLSMSDWSSSNNTVRQFCQYSGTKSDDNSLAELGASISDWSASTTVIPQQYYTSVIEKSQSDTTTSDKSITSMRPNSKCQSPATGLPPTPPLPDMDLDDDDVAEGNTGDWMSSGFELARKIIESKSSSSSESEPPPPPSSSGYPAPRITFEKECDVGVAIPEEDEDEQLYDNVPAMRYIGPDQIRVEMASRGDSSEDMHERYADMAGMRTRSADEEWSREDKREAARTPTRLDRGYSDPSSQGTSRLGSSSTERPVVVPIRNKSTPYYSTTSLSGESTTSSPPMPMKMQIRTKTMYSSGRSPQSEGDTSSSMESPGHTPDRTQRAFRRKRQQSSKRRHRVVLDFEVKDGQIVSSTDSSFDVANLPPPLLPENEQLEEGDEDDEPRDNA